MIKYVVRINCQVCGQTKNGRRRSVIMNEVFFHRVRKNIISSTAVVRNERSIIPYSKML